MLTLEDLDDPAARESVREAQVVLFVSPHTGYLRIIVGRSHVEAAGRSSDPEAGIFAVQISVEGLSVDEPESAELEVTAAAVLAIRGALDPDESNPGLQVLADTIGEHWARGLAVPWTEMRATNKP